MSEIATLEAIEATYGYLRRPGDASALIDNAAAFTRHAAWALRGDGWGNVRKTSGLNREGLDVDKLLHRTTLQMVDVVIAAGDPSQRVGWQPVATGTPNQFVEPRDPGTGDGPPPPEDNDLAAAIWAVLDELRAIRAVQEQQLELHGQVAAILARAAARFL